MLAIEVTLKDCAKLHIRAARRRQPIAASDHRLKLRSLKGTGEPGFPSDGSP
jgi:hypothetical protein